MTASGRFAPYENADLLQDFSRSYLRIHQILQDKGEHAPLERPARAEWRRWRSWRNRSLTNPLDCCGLGDDLQYRALTDARMTSFRPRPVSKPSETQANHVRET